jgi:BON domain
LKAFVNGGLVGDTSVFLSAAKLVAGPVVGLSVCVICSGMHVCIMSSTIPKARVRGEIAGREGGAARRDAKGVVEEIEAGCPLGIKHGDEEIASAAIGSLKWDGTIPGDAVKVTVEKGRITLTGRSFGTTNKKPPLTRFADSGTWLAYLYLTR